MKIIPVIAFFLIMFGAGTNVSSVHAQQQGGSAKSGGAIGGPAMTGGPNCNVAYACPITQSSRGGDATGGGASSSPSPLSLSSSSSPYPPGSPLQNIVDNCSRAVGKTCNTNEDWNAYAH